MVGLESDGTNANKCLYEIEKETFRDHFVLTWCLSHKLELAMHKSYKTDTQLEKDAQLQLANEYYIFKKATLKWHLFKCYAEILGQRAFRYKRPEGTKWLSHQTAALDIHLKNLKVMLAFSNEQVEVHYNSTMCKEMASIEGIRREATDLKLLQYQALRRDTMAYTVPCSLILEKVTLKISMYLSSEGISAMKRANILRMLNKEILPLLVINPNAPVPQEVELRSTNSHKDEIITFGRSTMRGRGIDFRRNIASFEGDCNQTCRMSQGKI